MDNLTLTGERRSPQAPSFHGETVAVVRQRVADRYLNLFPTLFPHSIQFTAISWEIFIIYVQKYSGVVNWYCDR